MINTTYTEDFIKEMYTRIGIIKPHQLQFEHVASALGVGVFYWQKTSQALFLESHTYIFLNDQLTVAQQWQDFCHELAHVLLHTGRQGRLPQSWIEYQENKANNFMYHACIPTFMLDDLNLGIILSVEYIQELFNVEYEVALKRLTQYNNNRIALEWNNISSKTMR